MSELDKKPRLLFVNYIYNEKAPEITLEEISRELSEKGYEIKILYQNKINDSSNKSQYSFIKDNLKRKFSKYFHGLNSIRKNILYIIREFKEVNEYRPDFIIYRSAIYNISSLIVAKRKKIPFIIMSDGADEYEYRISDFLLIPLIARKLLEINFKRANRIIALSNELKSYLLQYRVDADKISVISLGSDYHKFEKVDKDSFILSKYDLSEKIIVGFVGSFLKWHGLENLIKVIPNIIAKHENVKFLLVGIGPEFGCVKEFISRHKYETEVILVGYVPYIDIPKYINIMDITIMPSSNFYGTPLKIFEYMAAGKACIAPRLGPIANIIRDKKDGLLVDPWDGSELENAINILISDEKYRNELGENARNRIKGFYTWKHCANKIDLMLKNLDKQ